MNYRIKLYFALIATAFLISLSGIGFIYYTMKPHVFKNLQIKAMTVAATTAALIDVEKLKALEKNPDPTSPFYLSLKEQLIQARDANRRDHILVEYLYTFKPNPGGIENDIVYLVDAEEDLTKLSSIGTVDVNEVNLAIIAHLKENYSPQEFVEDFGTWVSAFSPVFDADGHYVATVGVDISEDRYIHYLNRLKKWIAMSCLASFLCAFIGAFFLSQAMTKALKTLMKAIREIGRGNFNYKTSLNTHDEFEDLGNEINQMTQGLKEREQLKLNFARYVSHQVLERVLSSEEGAKVEGELKEITVLFSDLRHFTLIAEKLPPEEVVSLLNEYFEAMLDSIFKYEGTLDKFIGDGILVEFGAPLDDPFHEKHAVQAALSMQKGLERLRKKWSKEGKPLLESGIGIHTGKAIVGNIGTEKRLEYTAIGDTVNRAIALERATKELKKPILISRETFEKVKELFKIEHAGQIGKWDVYEVKNDRA